MTINFRKLKSQIHPFQPEAKHGFIFIATKQQNEKFIFSISQVGSKRSLIKLLIYQIKHNQDYRTEFSS